jgi:hypothetical protein
MQQLRLRHWPSSDKPHTRPAAVVCHRHHHAARRVLEKYRFAVTFNGHTCKLMLAPQKGQADKDRVFGPFSYKFQVLVKVRVVWVGWLCWACGAQAHAAAVARPS